MSKMQQHSADQIFVYFNKICAIPHGSGNEKQIADFLCSFAADHQLSFTRDACHNVLIQKNGTGSLSDAPPVILQGHIDMVCESEKPVQHDFTSEPLTVMMHDGWIYADGTTLGADDGIAVAMMLCILADPHLLHPPLECLFTAQEEIGLIGAGLFDYSKLQGRRLINLDSEDEGRACVGCAGGVRCDFQRQCMRTAAIDSMQVKLCIDGLAGGHSGMDIAYGRTNANAMCAAILNEVMQKFPFSLISIDGGSKDNAITRSAKAVISCDSLCYIYLQLTAMKYQKMLIGADQNGIITVDRLTSPNSEVSAMTRADTDAVLGLMLTLPNGVISMDPDMTDLVHTSANLGVSKTTADTIAITSSLRSLSDAVLEEQKTKFTEIAATFGFALHFRGQYPGWEHHPDSLLRRLYQETFAEQYGHSPVIETIHAGLECGIFANHLPNLDAISIGPDMENVHTPRERLNIASVERVYRQLLTILEKLS